MINLVYTILPIATWIIGFCFGFYIRKNDELPEIKTPAQVFEEHQQKVNIKEEASKLDAYLENIDNYPNNQKDVR